MKPGNYWITFKDNDCKWFLRVHEVCGQFALIGWTEKEPWKNYWNSHAEEGDADWNDFHLITKYALEDYATPCWFNLDSIHHLRNEDASDGHSIV